MNRPEFLKFCKKNDVSRETLERLEIYDKLLRKWNPAINLVSPSTVDALWTRHFLDSAQLLEIMPDHAASWCDIGTGGGFPGIVIAILAHDIKRDFRMTCIESDVRKATFLRTVLRETGVAAEVISERIESAPSQGADVLSARALAPLNKLLEFAERHLSQNGICLFPKGARYQEEIDEALKNWCFEITKTPSVTSSDAAILTIGAIKRA